MVFVLRFLFLMQINTSTYYIILFLYHPQLLRYKWRNNITAHGHIIVCLRFTAFSFSLRFSNIMFCRHEWLRLHFTFTDYILLFIAQWKMLFLYNDSVCTIYIIIWPSHTSSLFEQWTIIIYRAYLYFY